MHVACETQMTSLTAVGDNHASVYETDDRDKAVLSLFGQDINRSTKGLIGELAMDSMSNQSVVLMVQTKNALIRCNCRSPWPVLSQQTARKYDTICTDGVSVFYSLDRDTLLQIASDFRLLAPCWTKSR